MSIFSPHAAVVSLLLVPVAATLRSRRLGAVVVAIAVVFALRFGGEWVSPEPNLASGTTFEVATWNVEVSAVSGAEAVDLLVAHPVDILVLQELSPRVAAAIEDSATLTARWPHRALFPDQGVLGIALLSTYPISGTTSARQPVRFEARVALEDGAIVVIGAHPLPARIAGLGGVPTGFDPTIRNADLKLLRDRVAELEARGEQVLLVGDFNTAPTEPAFARLTSGLRDAHADVGLGPGWTWRPRALESLGIGLLRIDLILSSTNVHALSTAVDCPRVGDHCLVTATLQR